MLGIFAGGVFDPREKVHLKSEVIDLPTYAARLNIQLLREVDFNSKLHGRGCKAMVQKICRVAKGEGEVRGMLEAMWGNPKNSREILGEAMEKNKERYEFERMLEEIEVKRVFQPVLDLLAT